ncbi:MAG: VCBS repeat-containing protein [Opitutaceae bacterium]|nr:VCBS repeat-containing protein [Opitutaceae bacterium]
MKRTPLSAVLGLTLLTLAVMPAPLPAANDAKAPPAKKAGAAKKAAAAVGVKFRVQQLHLDNNEGCDVADFNRDGKLDISAGEFWYPGPSFKDKKPLRKLEPFGKDYMTNCGEHAYDVNGDGWPDIVSGAFMDSNICWYENPRADGLKSGALWPRHVLIDTKLAQNEWTTMRDLNGDGRPEYIVNSYGPANAMMAYQFARDENNQPVLKPWTIQAGAPFVNGHGIGFGDVNGDGLEDMLYGNGWYERPKQGAMTQPWIRHPDWIFPHASTPMLVVDLTGDGRNDFIWGHGHNYGLYWEERRDDNKDGSTNWRHNLIDDRVSQVHCLAWEDIDNDGQPELITGRRVKAHSGNDPGDNEPGCVYYYKWDKAGRRFSKFIVAENGPGIGLQIRVADLDGNGWKDIVVSGKSGTHVLWNQGK